MLVRIRPGFLEAELTIHQNLLELSFRCYDEDEADGTCSYVRVYKHNLWNHGRVGCISPDTISSQAGRRFTSNPGCITRCHFTDVHNKRLTMKTAMGALMERWHEPNFDVDAVLIKVLEIVAATVPNANASELVVLLRSLAPDSNFAKEEQALRQARVSLSDSLGIDPEDTSWTIERWTPEKRVAAIFLCILEWCIDSENLGAEFAMEHSEDLLVEAGNTRREAAELLSAIVFGTEHAQAPA